MSNTHQRPEGHLIDNARSAARLSVRKAAAKANISEGRWRQIVNGYQSAGSGQVVTVQGPAETIARMAAAVGVPADELRRVGRADAADAMAEPFDAEEAQQAVHILQEQLNPDLLRFSDYELLSELHVRTSLMASRLHALGDNTLGFVTNAAGENVITSRPISGS